jgi:hypothetical protein
MAAGCAADGTIGIIDSDDSVSVIIFGKTD